MEVVASLFSSGGATAASAASAAGSAATGSGGFLGMSSQTASIMQGSGSILSAIGTISRGFGQADDLMSASYEAAGQQTEEQSAHLQRIGQMKREFLRTMGERDVAAAAGGVDTSFGIAADADKADDDRLTSESNIDQAGTDARIAALEQKRLAYRRLAGNARSGALLSAVSSLLQTGVSMGQRG